MKCIGRLIALGVSILALLDVKRGIGLFRFLLKSLITMEKSGKKRSYEKARSIEFNVLILQHFCKFTFILSTLMPTLYAVQRENGQQF